MRPANPLLPEFDQQNRWSDLFGIPTNARVGTSNAVLQMTELQGRLIVVNTNAGGRGQPRNDLANLMVFTGDYWRSLGAPLEGTIQLIASSNNHLLAAGRLIEGTNVDGQKVALQQIASWDGITWRSLDAGLSEVRRILKVNQNFYVLGTVNGRPDSIAKLVGSSWTILATLAPGTTVSSVKIIDPPSDFMVSDDDALFVQGKFESLPIPLTLRNGEPSEFIEKHEQIGIKEGNVILKTRGLGPIYTALKDGDGYLIGGDLQGKVTFLHPGFTLEPKKIVVQGVVKDILFHLKKTEEEGKHFVLPSGIVRVSENGSVISTLDGGVTASRSNAAEVLTLAREANGRVVVGGVFEFVGRDAPTTSAPSENQLGQSSFKTGPEVRLAPSSFTNSHPSGAGLPTQGLAFLKGTAWSVPDQPLHAKRAGTPRGTRFSSFRNVIREITTPNDPSVVEVLVGQESGQTYIGGVFHRSNDLLLDNVAVLTGKQFTPLANKHRKGIFGNRPPNFFIETDSQTGDIYLENPRGQAGDLQSTNSIICFRPTSQQWEELPDTPPFRSIRAFHLNQSGGDTNGHLYVLASSEKFQLPDGTKIEQGGLFRFDGKVWHGTPLIDTNMDSLEVNRLDQVYLKGSSISFTNSSGRSSHRITLTHFDGTAFHQLDRFRNGFKSGFILDMVLHGNNLFVAGRFTRIGFKNVSHVAFFDGFDWHGLGGGVRIAGEAATKAIANVIAVGEDGLAYLAGPFNEAVNPDGSTVTVNGIAVWNGFQWGDLGGGLDEFTIGGRASILQLTANSKGLFCYGNFTQIGGVPARHMARWDGQNWQPLATELEQSGVSFSTLDAAGEQLVMASSRSHAGLLGSFLISSYSSTPDEDIPLRVDPVFEPNFFPLTLRFNPPSGGSGKLRIFANADFNRLLFEQTGVVSGPYKWDGLVEVPFSDEERNGKPVAFVTALHSPLLIEVTFSDAVFYGLVEVDPYLRFELNVPKADQELLAKSLRETTGLNEAEISLQANTLLIDQKRSDFSIKEGSPLYRSYLQHLSHFSILRLQKTADTSPVASRAVHHFGWNYELPDPNRQPFHDPVLKMLKDLNV